MFENRRKTLIELFLQLQPISKIIQKLSFHPKISKLGISFAIRTDNWIPWYNQISHITTTEYSMIR